MKVTIHTSINAEQWLGEGHPLPEGAHLCRPEIHWSAGRKYIYFTYADLRSLHWIDVEENPLPAPDEAEFMASGFVSKGKDGAGYWRQSYPFAFYDMKSESQVTGDHRPVYLTNDADEALLRCFADYIWVEKWATSEGGVASLPPRAEYRVVDGGFGRRFRPFYMKPGDWLLHETDADGNPSPRVVSDEQFAKLRA